MGSRRIPNDLLRALLDEAGWTGEALARAVNALGAEVGLLLRYSRATISHWLSGMRPRPPVPELVAEAFFRRLGRPITVSATGLEKPVACPVSVAVGQWWEGNTVAQLVELAGHGTRRREFVAGCVYSLASLSVPGWAELTATPGRRRPDTDPATKVGRADVDSATVMLRLFSDADSTFGGGHARRALSGYLGSTIGPWLRAGATSSVRRDLLIAASQLTYLCGFMCFDDQLHGAAQRYYRTSLWLTAEAGDATGHAVTLRGLSAQARLLGHHRQAVDLAEAAVRTGLGSTSPQIQAFLLGQFAVATAAVGDHRAAIAHITRAEQFLHRSDSTPKSVGACHPASLAHQQAAVAACLGDRRGAVAALESSIRHRPAGERRSRAITLARLAELQFAGGQLEKACHTWHRFLDDYPDLRSGRADRAFAHLRACTRPHGSDSVARQLRLRAASLAAARRSDA
jgi:transcriptional regulator with XRE-family HTH domain